MVSSLAKHFSDYRRVAEETLPPGSLLPTEFVIDASAHDGGRHYAYCASASGVLYIVFAPEAAKLGDQYQRALMAHEWGHAIDFSLGRDLSEHLGGGFSSDPEARADQIAEAVFGEVVLYDPDMGYVQCFSCNGVPRPRGLR